MTYLLVQIALLILGAYLLGAVIGCVWRRLHDYVFGKNDKSSSDSVAVGGAAPVIEVSNQGATAGGEQSRFERALSQGPGSEGSEKAQQDTASEEASTADTVTLDTPSFSPVADPSPSSDEPSPSVVEASSTSSSDVDEGEPFTSVSVAAAAAAAAIAARGGISSAGELEAVVDPDPVSKPVLSDDQQDLTRIKGIDGDLQRQLFEVEVARYEHISAWTADDVSQVESLLSSPGRVSRENWIEQAQILATGGVTEFARERDAGGGAKAKESSVSSLNVSPVKMDLSDPPSQAVVEETASDVSGSDAGDGSGQDGENSEAGMGNDHSIVSAAAAAATATATAATMAAATATSAHSSYEASAREIEEVGADPLSRIKGIDDQTAGWLNGQGVLRFEQIANWSDHDVDHFEDLFGSSGRIRDERWVEQAGFLARGEDDVPTEILTPVPSAAPAPDDPVDGQSESEESSVTIVESSREVEAEKDETPSSESDVKVDAANLSGFRSVRSAALRGGVGALLGNDFDDLKRIRGVGILIEKKLNSLGVTSYEHVANWTNEDIDRISQQLEFKGRIQRENWVEQARILSSGGATEFSRRMDRKVD